MNWLDGISTCSQLGVDDCVIWWEAWAVVAAFVGVSVALVGVLIAYLGVLGSWAAAFATYHAVVQPFRRRKLEERVAADLAMENFASDLIGFRYGLGAASLHVAWLKPDNPDDAKASVKRLRIRSVLVPSLVPTPENRTLVQLLNRLRRSIGRWNDLANDFDISPDPALPSDYPDIAIGTLKHQLQKVLDDIRAVAREMESYAPFYADELRWVAESGDGFIPFYGDGQDELAGD
ncbi:hypothetical protein JAK58_14360 [Stenotrophomonas maltophilia]|uniref:hypothetical protein n=1 Tax=Stenotrophomonas maltophilia TaxID=40324 RepID=UPI0021C8491F|nr:hypothetical protein [Stenotrophomonas maltophilia]MCU1092694.1 hypothetical protein [Stenotrophomonas maltophilia]